jgi:hypothetical protein
MVEPSNQPAPAPGRLTESDAGAPRARWWDREIATGTGAGLALGALAVAFLAGPASHSAAPVAPVPVAMPAAHSATFGDEAVSAEVRMLAQWVAQTDDARGAPFVVIDKRRARLHVFDAQATLAASTPILLGGARGDDTVPGIGDRPLADVRPDERTTPAGRFIGERGHNARGEDVVWVDYDAGVSMHRVLTTNPKERRLERLATPTADDNRISYGCINVPVAFYETRLAPLFDGRDAPIYVLPEVRTMAEVFGHRDVASLRGPGPSTLSVALHDERP